MKYYNYKEILGYVDKMYEVKLIARKRYNDNKNISEDAMKEFNCYNIVVEYKNNSIESKQTIKLYNLNDAINYAKYILYDNERKFNLTVRVFEENEILLDYDEEF